MSRNRGDSTCDCGLSFAHRPEIGRRPESELFDGCEYKKRAGLERMRYPVEGWHEKGTLFGKIICPICRTEYLGWFHPPDYPKHDGLEWQIYDTSYWSSFNDEPGEEDKRNWRDPVEVLKILDANP